MLFSLGGLAFEVVPFNTHNVERQHSADFAAKDLLGRRKSHEFVGAGDERVSFSCVVYPQKFGGLDEMGALNAMRESGAQQMLVRGDGTPMGWFLVERVRERSSFLDGRGVGKKIEVDIELIRDDAPTAAQFVASLFSLFG